MSENTWCVLSNFYLMSVAIYFFSILAAQDMFARSHTGWYHVISTSTWTNTWPNLTHGSCMIMISTWYHLMFTPHSEGKSKGVNSEVFTSWGLPGPSHALFNSRQVWLWISIGDTGRWWEMVILGIQETSLGQLGHGPSAAGLRSSGPCTNNAATDGGRDLGCP